MAPLPDYVAGTITLTNNSTAFTGTGTGWLAAGFREGDTILGIEDNPGVVYVVESVTDNDSGTLTQPWDGPTGTYTYRMRYLSDGQRVTAQARQLIEMLGNGNLQAVAGLPGTPNTFMMFTGAGSVVEVPRTDLVSGANYDVQVDTLAERAAYDGSDEGFAVLVADTGDGRAAIYSKLSGAVGDWSGPAYVTGPSTDITVGSVTEIGYGEPPVVSGTSGPGTLELDFSLPGGPELSVGSVTRGDADVTSTPVTGGYELDFTIPSQVAQGDYSGATSYVTGDIVQDGGSSWVALQDTTGNAPPSLPTTSNTYWQLLARAGNDGAGTVSGLVEGDGIGIDSTDPTMPVVSGVLFDEDIQGDVPGPSSADIAAGRVLAADGTWIDVSTDPWGSQPLGVPIPVWTHINGVEEPPTDQNYRYIKLTASDAYNSGVLTGESVTGSAPLVVATAVIDDVLSPLDGETVQLINTERRALRAGSSGSVQNDQMQQITGDITQGEAGVFFGRGAPTGTGALDVLAGTTSLTSTGNTFTSYNVFFNSANSSDARTGNETRSKNIGADYYMRIR